MNSNLGPAPASHLISFDPSCFAAGPVRVFYSVDGRRFETLAAARSYAMQVGRAVIERTESTQVRVKWF